MNSFVVASIGVGLTLIGILMLVRPKLSSDVPPDPTQSLRSIRIGGLVFLFFGIYLLWVVLVEGLRPCLPNECLDF
jgi:hypothetical protein